MKCAKLGIGCTAAGFTANTVPTNTTQSEKMLIFSMKDILIEDDNFIPAFVFD